MLYAIGDIHGEIRLLRSLYAKILTHINNGEDAQNTIIFLGDYIDRGENSKLVLDFLINLDNSDKLTHIFIMGNHEEMMVDAFNPKMFNIHMWLNNGGKTTLRDFKTDVYSFKSSDMYRYVDWIQKHCIYHYSTEDYVFCHGGLRIDTSLDDTALHVFTWKRTTNQNEYDTYEKMVIHGHTPQTLGIPLVLKNEINVDTHAVYTKKLTCVVLPERANTEAVTFIT